MRVLFAIILGIGYLATYFQENCANVGYFFAVGKNIVDKHFLRDFVISKFTVLEPMECFRKCRLECKCISFNYWTTKNEDNCELNYENRYLKPSKLRPQAGAQYYDLVMDYNVVVRFTLPLCYSFDTILPLYLLRLVQFSSRTPNARCFESQILWSNDLSIVEEVNFILHIISLRSA